MQSTLENLLSADNTTRNRAEADIEQAQAANPSAFAANLLQNLTSPKVEVAQLCCSLIKKFFLNDRSTTQLGEADLDSLRQALLDSMDFASQPLLLLKRKGEVLSKIYAKLNKSEAMLAYLVQLASSADSKTRQFAMYCFEVLSELHLSSAQLTGYKNDFMQIFEKGLQDADISVRVASLKAISAFFSGLEDSEVVLSFAPVLPVLMGTVVETLQKDEDQGRSALESLQELTSAHPEVWKANANQLINIISQIIQQKSFEPGTRAAASEVILALSEQMAATLRKTDETRTMLFPAFMSMLMEAGDIDDSEWASTEDDVNNNNLATDPVSIAKSSIQRLTDDLGEKHTLACAQPILQECLTSDNWVRREAGQMLYGMIAPTCKAFLKSNLKQALQQSMAGVEDSNTRVRYAGLYSLAMLFSEMAPKLQLKAHAEVMPKLGNLMMSEQLIKMQTQATSALLNFVTGLSQSEEDDAKAEQIEEADVQEMMSTYSKDLLGAMVTLLRKGIQEKYEPLQTEVLNTLSAICSVIGLDFSAYFDEFVPMLSEILGKVGTSTMQDKTLRSQTMDTLGAIIQAVTNENPKLNESSPFNGKIIEMATYLCQQLQAGFSDDDPQSIAVKDTLTRCAGFLGPRFAQFMPMLLTQLLTDAQLTIDFKMQDADMPDTQTGNGAESFKMKVKGMGEQRISMSTEALVRKTSAFDTLEKISDIMGTSFAPYCEPLLPVVSAHMTYAHSKVIRKKALMTFRHILVAMGEPNNLRLFQEAFPTYTSQIADAHKKMDKKLTKLYIKQLADVLRDLNKHNVQYREFLTQEQINSLGPLIKMTLTLVTALRQCHKKVLTDKKKNHDIDEEDVERLKMDLAKVSSVACQVMELTGQLVEIFKEKASQMVAENAKPFFWEQLNQQDLTDDELLDALCFFCDFVDNTENGKDQKMVNELGRKFLEICQTPQVDESEDLQQTLAFGFGVFAYAIPHSTFGPLKAAVAVCRNILEVEDAFDEDRLQCTESTMGAMAKMCYRHMDGKTLSHNDLVPILSKMPFTAFEDENKSTHKTLIEQWLDAKSVLHANPALEQAAREALVRVRDYNGDAVVLSHESKQALASLQL